jgi:hypothetical protein
MSRLLRSLAMIATVLATVLTAIVATMLTATPAFAHEERPAVEPDGSGHVPAYRATSSQTLLVCKTDKADFEQRIAGFFPDLKARNETLFGQCVANGFRDIQAAVDAAHDGADILVLPGVYQEEPSLAAPSDACAHLQAPYAKLGYQILSWEQQNQCPHNQNLVAIFSKPNLQIEGTGERASDVMLDGQFKRLNGFRADRSNGIYFKNIAAERFTFNAFYIMETDGFVLDGTMGRWDDEYAFLTFADDHGLYKDCEAYGNGDSGVYPGAAHNINLNQGHNPPRYAIEVRNCYSHDNTLGYSGTAGDSVWAHDNVFIHNGTGVSTDSAFPNHPGMPQNHAKFENNIIADNNTDYYGYVRDGTCAKDYADRGYEHGVVCPSVGIPTGTGVINPGGNYNIWQHNYIYGNHYSGLLTTWAPGFVRDANTVAAQFDTSHHNRYLGNVFGVDPRGNASPNGMDVWWDGQGTHNCWQADRPDGSEPMAVPECGSGFDVAGFGSARYVAEPLKIATLLNCNTYDLVSQSIPESCQWFGATGLDRYEVRISLGENILIVLVLAVLWWRRLRGSMWGSIASLCGLAGAVIGVFGSAYLASPLSGIGFALLGAWWVVAGLVLRRHGRPRLGSTTIALGVVALLNAIDTTLWIIPFTPASPAWFRVLLMVVWVPWALIAAARGERPAAAAEPIVDPDAEPAIA